MNILFITHLFLGPRGRNSKRRKHGGVNYFAPPFSKIRFYVHRVSTILVQIIRKRKRSIVDLKMRRETWIRIIHLSRFISPRDFGNKIFPFSVVPMISRMMLRINNNNNNNNSTGENILYFSLYFVNGGKCNGNTSCGNIILLQRMKECRQLVNKSLETCIRYYSRSINTRSASSRVIAKYKNVSSVKRTRKFVHDSRDIVEISFFFF